MIWSKMRLLSFEHAVSSTVVKPTQAPTKKKRGRPKKSVVFSEALEKLGEESGLMLTPPTQERKMETKKVVNLKHVNI